jgi:uncharacterized protein (DUF697 family)
MTVKNGANGSAHVNGAGRAQGPGAQQEATHAGVPRDERARAIVTRTSIGAAAIGAILSPIPLADELVLVPVYAVMAARIGRVHRLALTKMPWRVMGRTTLTGLGVRAGLNLAFAFVPGVAAIANATSAATLTVLLGKWFDDACRDPKGAKPVSPAMMLEALKSAATDAMRRPVSASA